MAKYEWQDSTSYKQGERGKVEPRSWELRGKAIRIIVTRVFSLEGWYLLCYDLRVDQPVKLGAKELKKAQLEALEFIRRRAQKILWDIEGAQEVALRKQTNG